MSTYERLTKIIREKCNIDTPQGVNPETRFAEELHLDSLDMYEMIIEIEDEFKITIPEEKYEKVEKIADVVTVIEQCL